MQVFRYFGGKTGLIVRKIGFFLAYAGRRRYNAWDKFVEYTGKRRSGSCRRGFKRH
jgi:hypothetical protein